MDNENQITQQIQKLLQGLSTEVKEKKQDLENVRRIL